VSRKHCQLDCDLAALSITDLGSSNGTTVNGERLKPKGKRPLVNGDLIEVGNVKFRVEQIEETALMPGSQRPVGVKPADTAISEPIALDESDVASDDATQVVKTNGTAGPTAKPVAAESPAGIGEDEVADFLMNIELDEEDKL
jgi:pSer/pThr/pTyr-binding forkhead associated (FHA) protein